MTSPSPDSAVSPVTLKIAYTWDGLKLSKEEQATVALWSDGDKLWISVDAPFGGDPPPDTPPGSTARLWTREVVECFLAAAGKPYLEVELGPHGHYLVLKLSDVREVSESGLALSSYETTITGGRWQGVASFPLEYLPGRRVTRGNAFAIRGVGSARNYMTATPEARSEDGKRPDFHQPALFQPIALKSERGDN